MGAPCFADDLPHPHACATRKDQADFPERSHLPPVWARHSAGGQAKPPSFGAQVEGRQGRAHGFDASHLPPRSACEPDGERIGARLCDGGGAEGASEVGQVCALGGEAASGVSFQGARRDAQAVRCPRRVDRGDAEVESLKETDEGNDAYLLAFDCGFDFGGLRCAFCAVDLMI